MAEETKTPPPAKGKKGKNKLGGIPKPVLALAGGLVLFLGYKWYKNRQTAAAASTTTTPSTTSAGDNTGIPMGSGSPGGGLGGGYGGGYGGGSRLSSGGGSTTTLTTAPAPGGGGTILPAVPGTVVPQGAYVAPSYVAPSYVAPNNPYQTALLTPSTQPGGSYGGPAPLNPYQTALLTPSTQPFLDKTTPTGLAALTTSNSGPFPTAPYETPPQPARGATAPLGSLKQA